MEPTLLVGDRIFVSKLTYGYSKHSLPFSPPILNKRIFKSSPEYGDLVVFKTPADNRTDYIKRLIGLPGDKLQFINGRIKLNGEFIERTPITFNENIRCGSTNIETKAYEEVLPNGVKYIAVYKKKGSYQNSDVFIVPENKFFFLGDNRDCSKDSRYLTSVGYVHNINLVGKAKIIFFSNDTLIGSMFNLFNLNKSFRLNRTLKTL